MKTIDIKSKSNIHKVLIDDEDYERISNFKWHISNGYARRTFGIKEGYNPRKSIAMQRIVMNCPDSLEVDHINRNRLDNRKSNLRICTRSINLLNRGSYIRYPGNGLKIRYINGYSGITFHSKRKRWDVRVFTNGKQRHIASFSNHSGAKEFLRDWAIANL